MEKITLSEGLMARMMETEAWQNISGDYPFSEVQLEKFADKVDWEWISDNRHIAWTVSILEKFKGRLHWDRLAGNRSDEFSCIDLLEKFKDCWDWDKYSGIGILTMPILERFADRLNWEKVINNWYLQDQDIDVNAVLDRFGDRIPVTKFKNSILWKELVDRKEKDLKKTLCLG